MKLFTYVHIILTGIGQYAGMIMDNPATILLLVAYIVKRS